MISSYKLKTDSGKRVGTVNLTINPALTNKTSLKRKQLAEAEFPVKNMLANRILTSLNDGDFARLILQTQTISIKSGDIIYQPEGDCRFIYFPETAVFSQMSILENGKTAETAMIGYEGVIGLSSVLGAKRINFWTQTLISGKAFRISAEVFSRQFIENGLLQNSFFEYLNEYIEHVSQRAVCNNHHRIENRFSTWLLMLADRCGKDNLLLTQEQIAAVLGVQRPSVTCIAQHLRNTGSINYIRGRIILNRSKLEEAACECYSAIK